jgi:hypothetical protein|tara:strand:- start:90 stop:380 length:291 start_codon:yes stop_codon:yes gene_type:complete
MNISNDTSAHDMRIILTRTVHTVDAMTLFSNITLKALLNVADKLETVLMLEKEFVTTLVMKEMVSMDIEALNLNMGVIKSSIKLNMYEFEYELCMN